MRDTNNVTWILDWDNAGLASPTYDLSFVTRALQEKVITSKEVERFCQGYGQSIPPLELANAYGTLHRVRWIISLLHRIQANDSHARKLLKEEKQLWSAQAGPLMRF